MSGEGGPLAAAMACGERWPLDPRAAEFAEIESYVTGNQRPLLVLGPSPDGEMGSAEERVLALLAADPICVGRVGRATIRSLAFLIVTPPAPLAIDGAAERADVLAHLSRRRANAARLAGSDFDGEGLARDRQRQLEVAIDEIKQGLHTGAAQVAAALQPQGV